MTPRAPRRRRAFSLVELLTVVGILTLLTGLTVTVATALARRGEVERTRRTLEILDLALREWEQHAERRLSRGPDAAFDLRSDTQFIFVTTEMLQVMRRVPAVRALLATIDPGAVYTYESHVYPPWIRDYLEELELARFVGGIAVLDAWGTPIYATHPGEPRRAGMAGPFDEDGTERTPNEALFGIAQQRRTFFVSAGPDGRFGLPQEFPGLSGYALTVALRRAREDNLHHPYTPEIP